MNWPESDPNAPPAAAPAEVPATGNLYPGDADVYKRQASDLVSEPIRRSMRGLVGTVTAAVGLATAS